jgi:hypothetical protein
MIAAAIRMLHRHGISLAVLFAMAVAWQALSMIYRAEALPGEPMVPGWQIVFTRTLVSLSDYWRGGLGVKAVADGAERSAIGGVLSIWMLRSIRSSGSIPALRSAPCSAACADWQCPGRTGHAGLSHCRCT